MKHIFDLPTCGNFMYAILGGCAVSTLYNIIFNSIGLSLEVKPLKVLVAGLGVGLCWGLVILKPETKFKVKLISAWINWLIGI